MCSVVGGMLIALIYDGFRIKRKAVKTRSIVIHIEDMIFWLIVAVVMFAVIYYSNEGELRGYIFIGTIIGVILYSLLFSKLVVQSSMFVIRFIVRVVKTICKIIVYPFRLLFRILAYPICGLINILHKCFKGFRRIVRGRLAKAAIWNKLLKNIRKKI